MVDDECLTKYSSEVWEEELEDSWSDEHGDKSTVFEDIISSEVVVVGTAHFEPNSLHDELTDAGQAEDEYKSE